MVYTRAVYISLLTWSVSVSFTSLSCHVLKIFVFVFWSQIASGRNKLEINSVSFLYIKGLTLLVLIFISFSLKWEVFYLGDLRIFTFCPHKHNYLAGQMSSQRSPLKHFISVSPYRSQHIFQC